MSLNDDKSDSESASTTSMNEEAAIEPSPNFASGEGVVGRTIVAGKERLLETNHDNNNTRKRRKRARRPSTSSASEQPSPKKLHQHQHQHQHQQRSTSEDDVVLCGRGIPIQNNPGNTRFHDILKAHREEYHALPRHEKSRYIKNLVREVRRKGLKFLNRVSTSNRNESDDGAPGAATSHTASGGEQWEEMDEVFIYEKVSHGLRRRDQPQPQPQPHTWNLKRSPETKKSQTKQRKRPAAVSNVFSTETAKTNADSTSSNTSEGLPAAAPIHFAAAYPAAASVFNSAAGFPSAGVSIANQQPADASGAAASGIGQIAMDSLLSSLQQQQRQSPQPGYTGPTQQEQQMNMLLQLISASSNLSSSMQQPTFPSMSEMQPPTLSLGMSSVQKGGQAIGGSTPLTTSQQGQHQPTAAASLAMPRQQSIPPQNATQVGAFACQHSYQQHYPQVPQQQQPQPQPQPQQTNPSFPPLDATTQQALLLSVLAIQNQSQQQQQQQQPQQEAAFASSNDGNVVLASNNGSLRVALPPQVSIMTRSQQYQQPHQQHPPPLPWNNTIAAGSNTNNGMAAEAIGTLRPANSNDKSNSTDTATENNGPFFLQAFAALLLQQISGSQQIEHQQQLPYQSQQQQEQPRKNQQQSSQMTMSAASNDAIAHHLGRSSNNNSFNPAAGGGASSGALNPFLDSLLQALVSASSREGSSSSGADGGGAGGSSD